MAMSQRREQRDAVGELQGHRARGYDRGIRWFGGLREEAIDASPQMLRLTRRRIEASRWPNVMHVEQAVLGAPSDAALFSLTHDVLQSEAALHNVFRARGGAYVAWGRQRPEILRRVRRPPVGTRRI